MKGGLVGGMGCAIFLLQMPMREFMPIRKQPSKNHDFKNEGNKKINPYIITISNGNISGPVPISRQ